MTNLVNAVSQVKDENNTVVTDAEQPSIVFDQGEEKDFDQHPVFTEDNFMTPGNSVAHISEFINPEAAHILSTSISKGDVNQTVTRIDKIVRTSHAIKGDISAKITLNVFLENTLVLGKKKGAKFINEVSKLLHNDEVEDDAWFKYLVNESANSRVFEGILKEFLETEIEVEYELNDYKNVKTVVDVLLPKFSKQIEGLAKAFKENDFEEYKRIMFLIQDLMAEDEELDVLVKCLKEGEEDRVVVDTRVSNESAETEVEDPKSEEPVKNESSIKRVNNVLRDALENENVRIKKSNENETTPNRNIQVIKAVGPLSPKKVKELHDKIKTLVGDSKVDADFIPTEEQTEEILEALNNKPESKVSDFYDEDFYKVNNGLFINLKGELVSKTEFGFFSLMGTMDMGKLLG